MINMKGIFKMKQTVTTSILVAFCFSSIQPSLAQEEAPILYSNMNTTQIATLFKNVGFAGYAEWFTNNHKQHKKVAFRWFGNNGKRYTCAYNTDFNTHKYYKAQFWTDTHKSGKFKTKYPVLKARLSNGRVTYNAPQYSSSNGKLIEYGEYKSERKWKASRTGHLQKRIPAIVYLSLIHI